MSKWIKDMETGKEWGPISEKRMTWNEAQEWAKKQGGRVAKRWELVQLCDEWPEEIVGPCAIRISGRRRPTSTTPTTRGTWVSATASSTTTLRLTTSTRVVCGSDQFENLKLGENHDYMHSL